MAQAQAGTDERALTPLIVDVEVNGAAEGPARSALRHDGKLLFSRADLQAWRVVVPAQAAVTVDGADYYDPAALPDGSVTLEESTQTAQVRLPATAFVPRTLDGKAASRPPLTPSVNAAFLNYSVALQHDSNGTAASGLLDSTVSGHWGLLANSVIVGQSTYQNATGASSLSRMVRLESYYRHDDPDRLTRLTIGDGITQNAAWSTPSRFGGVQFGTQFGLSPGYIGYPVPSLTGGSAVASTLEAYVNNTLHYQGQVDSGPFSLGNVPVLTGAGEMSFAVSDALGVRRTVKTPYYVSTNLLRSGLSDYSVNLGWTRLNYGLQSNDYGSLFAFGNWRRGLSETATMELHGETGARIQVAGTGLTWVWAPLGEFGLHGAASRTQDTGGGRLGRVSFAHIASDWSFSASRQSASAGFMQVAWLDSQTHTTGQTQLFVGRSLGRSLGSLGLAYTALRYSGGDEAKVLSLNHSIQFGSVYLNTYVARTDSGDTANRKHVASAGFMLTLPLGDRQTASASTNRQNGKTTTTVDVNQAAPSDQGWGWRVIAAHGETERAQAEATWRAPYASLTAQAVNLDNETSARLLAEGSLGYTSGMFFAAQSSSDGFALVTVLGAPGIKVYRENNPATTTDSEGRALVTGLRAYELNKISVDNGDLPISAQVHSDVLQVVPSYKGVAAATFDIARDPIATMQILLPDASPLPAGIDVTGEDRPFALITGYGGTLQLERPRAGERFEARWRNGHCSFTVGPVPTTGALPQIGPYTCETMPAPSAH
ncbi:fimbria/pilus outer membrane usher protein [Variovorax sp. Varisp62]|uniref:fimbria/pilus outer membrane usher protein n=1 Tax=Variovorax sp. Varisp62 TaxID=3243049 RepID=UPI0039B6A83C